MHGMAWQRVQKEPDRRVQHINGGRVNFGLDKLERDTLTFRRDTEGCGRAKPGHGLTDRHDSGTQPGPTGPRHKAQLYATSRWLSVPHVYIGRQSRTSLCIHLVRVHKDAERKKQTEHENRTWTGGSRPACEWLHCPVPSALETRWITPEVVTSSNHHLCKDQPSTQPARWVGRNRYVILESTNERLGEAC